MRAVRLPAFALAASAAVAAPRTASSITTKLTIGFIALSPFESKSQLISKGKSSSRSAGLSPFIPSVHPCHSLKCCFRTYWITTR
jgi:hypothetical protein